MSKTTEYLQDEISKHISAIRRLWKDSVGIQVTVVCRNPNNPNGGCMVGNDEPEDVIAEIQRRCDPAMPNEVLPANRRSKP